MSIFGIFGGPKRGPEKGVFWGFWGSWKKCVFSIRPENPHINPSMIFFRKKSEKMRFLAKKGGPYDVSSPPLFWGFWPFLGFFGFFGLSGYFLKFFSLYIKFFILYLIIKLNITYIIHYKFVKKWPFFLILFWYKKPTSLL